MRKRLTNTSWAIPLHVGWLVAIGFAVGSMLLLSPSLGSMRARSSATAAPSPTPTPQCTADIECSDGVFCNGIERCVGNQSGADSRGCVVSAAPPCAIRESCNEDKDRCETSCVNPDHDGDGHRAVRCGGDDCDDRDANRYPGRQEVCDLAGHDEDCDPSTYGLRDRDGDTENDIRCCNREANGTLHCGSDYDDNNSAIRVGSMICDGADMVVVSGSSSVKCPDGTKCLAQPNGTGICIVPPANYVAPERFVRPPPPPELPALGTPISMENLPRVLPGATESITAATPDRPLLVGPQVIGTTDSTSGSPAEVAECKRTLQSGTVSWGGGMNWASANIDKLCNGTANAKKTIACFQSNVEALGWAAAIDKCR